ncbi:MAG TPA: 30S ribosomal protein S12 methylthiotransferase RimO [Actinobacteria bacterium]|nr:30S ribosomal protein S12 methylthiotransferase RimO [Actinomycetes bacterium]HEX21394.1 30S ribosomal protein S12 methylthiotransferase RimO [Actinomycetota bacterium]
MQYENVAVVTMGCPKNEVVSRGIQEQLLKYGLTVCEEPDNCDLILVNTCGFIEPAKEESINILLELAKLKENGKCVKIFAVGCLVQRYRQELSDALPEIDGFISLEEVADLPKLLGIDNATVGTSKDRHLPATKPWAYLQISEGCSRRCSFCVIPMIKGPYRSRHPEEIIREAEILVANGARELIIVGQDTGAYGSDLKVSTNLSQLVNGLSRIKDLLWLRLMYLYPDYLQPELIEVFRDNPKLCNYLDIPLQHASKKLLTSMRRSGSAEDYLAKLQRLARVVPDIAIRSEFIVGYPGESGDDFKELSDFVKELSPDYLGLFKYSSESGTKASELPNRVSKSLMNKRYHKLRSLADEIGIDKKKVLIGAVRNVLIERVLNTTVYEGRLACQAPEIDGDVTLRSEKPLKVGALAEVVITASNGYDLEAEII